MFTGIIQHLGTVVAIEKSGDWKFRIQAPEAMEGMTLGASVACSGVCLTVIERDAASFLVQVSAETLSCTTLGTWHEGTRVNLERALRLGDELGGHIVSGHVDGLATLLSRRAENDSLRLVFELPKDLARFVAPKGSIALDGVSLTVNEVEGATFGINIIPFTQQKTTLGSCLVGEKVNAEVDVLARYVARMNGPDV